MRRLACRILNYNRDDICRSIGKFKGGEDETKVVENEEEEKDA